MPSKAPEIDKLTARQLQWLGLQLRAQRKHLGVSASTAAESAGMSRVTLHRIERGEPSVTMGAYLNAAAVLGMDLRVAPGGQPASQTPTLPPSDQPRQHPLRAAGGTAAVQLADYPQLQRLAWQHGGATEVTPAEALNLYERNWRHIDAQALLAEERALIQSLVAAQGGSRLLV